MPRSSASSKWSGSSKKKASSIWVLVVATSMSSRIIRGDGRLQTLKISSPSEKSPENQIMEVEKQAFEQGYAEGERIGKQMGEKMIETIVKRYENSLAQLAESHKGLVEAME